jgi:hypothetical protein
MPTATITATGIVRRYADDIAYVAEQDPATDLDSFIDQLGTAEARFSMAGINGHEDVGTAARHLAEARDSSDGTARDAFLRRVDKLLQPVDEMTDEYREMVGD